MLFLMQTQCFRAHDISLHVWQTLCHHFYIQSKCYNRLVFNQFKAVDSNHSNSQSVHSRVSNTDHFSPISTLNQLSLIVCNLSLIEIKVFVLINELLIKLCSFNCVQINRFLCHSVNTIVFAIELTLLYSS